MGFRADGRVTAVDLSIVQQNGPYNGGGDLGAAAGAITLLYQPPAMRYRGIQVSTNTTPTGAQRGPGQNQIAAAVEPLIDKAAKALNLDRVAIRRINAAGNDAKYDAQQGPVTSAYQRDALERGAAAFNWEERKSRSGQSARLEGHRRRHRPSVPRRRPRRPRRHRAHHARRQAAHPLRRRQSRHVLVCRRTRASRPKC